MIVPGAEYRLTPFEDWNMKTIKQSDINHLRRIIDYVRWEIGEDVQQTIQLYTEIAKTVDAEPDEAAKQRIMESIKKAANVPQYIRRAITALEKVVDDCGDIVDAEASVESEVIICNEPNRLAIRD